MKAPGKGAAVLAVTAMSVLFGASFVATKIALTAFAPSVLIFLRFALASLLFLLLAPWTGLWGLDRKGAAWVFLLALFEPGAYFFLEAAGIQRTLASTAAVIIATIPVFVLLLEAFWLQVRVRLREAALVFLSLLGIVLLVLARGLKEAVGGSRTGNLLVLGAAFTASVYTAMARKLLQRYSPLVVTRLQSFYAAALYLPFAVGSVLREGLPAPAPRALGALAYLAGGCSFLAYLLLNFSLSRLRASTVAAFTNVIPVVAALLAVFLLGERLVFLQVLGAAVVVASVTLLTLWSGSEREIGRRLAP